MAQLSAAEQHLRRLLRTRFDQAQERLRALSESRVLRDPYLQLREQERMLDELQQRATRSMRHHLERGTAELARYVGQLESLSPLQVLARGYSLTQRSGGKVVRSVTDVSKGDEIHIRVSDGTLSANVTQAGSNPTFKR